MSRPRGHVPANRGKPNWLNREQPRAAVPLIRELFAKIDAMDISLEAFGKRCDYSKVSLSRWSHGLSKPTLPTLLALAKAAGYRLELVPVEDENKIDGGL